MIKKILFILPAILLAVTLWGQSPNAFKYQAVIRNSSGNILSNQRVGTRISVLQGNISGDVVYSETHIDTTNNFGLITVNVGEGSIVSGNFSSINWGTNAHFIKIEIDPAGGTSYQIMGISQLLSVPYALYSKEAGDVKYHQQLSKSGDTILLSYGGFVLDANTLYKAGAGVKISGDTIINSMPGFKSLSQPEIDLLVPIAGTMVYNTTSNKLNLFNGTNWYEIPYGDCVPYPTVANAGTDQTQTNDSVFTLSANTPQYGKGTWSIESGTGGIINDIHDPNALFTGRRSQSYTLRWKVENNCGSNFDDIIVQILCSPLASSEAGADKSSSNGSFAVTMGATPPASGTGSWSIVSGSGGSLSDIHNPAATFTGTPIQGQSAVSYSLSWTVTNECNSASDGAGVVVGCDAGLIYCNPSCINKWTDANNCGSCGHACGTAPHAILKCQGGACIIDHCDSDWKDCNGLPSDGCEIYTADPSYCGSCVICGPGYKCCQGACVPTKPVGTTCTVNCECPTACVGGFCQ